MSRRRQAQIARALAAKRLEQVRCEDAAKLVREQLMQALDSGELPSLPAEVVRRARKARPYGEFPSHRVLMMAYGDKIGIGG